MIQSAQLFGHYPTQSHHRCSWLNRSLFFERLVYEFGEFAFFCELGGVGHREIRVYIHLGQNKYKKIISKSLLSF